MDIQGNPYGFTHAMMAQDAQANTYNSNLVKQHQALTASLSESQSSVPTSSLHASNVDWHD